MLLCAEPTASFPAKIGAKSGTLTIRIYNSRDQQTPPEAVSLLVNGCAAHDWGQVLTFEGKNGPHFRAFTSHPERSEGSVAIGSEMLRCAQHDRAGPCC